MTVQRYLNAIAAKNPSIGTLTVDGVFGPRTEASVLAFQRLSNIAANGIVGPVTWAWLVSAYNALPYSSAMLATFQLPEESEVNAMRIEPQAGAGIERQDILPLMMLMLHGLNR
jgi:hypothetical protein